MSLTPFLRSTLQKSAILFAAALFCIPVSAATLPLGFTETSIGGLSNPTAFAIHPDGRIFVTQQGGALRIIKNGALLPTPFTTVTTTSSGERGLLGIAIDPNYAVNRFIYVYYTATSPSTHNRVSRFTADAANEDVAVAGSEVPILDLENLSATNHNGGAIHFGPDGKLYVAVGENAVSSNSQSIGNRLGKMLRINSDGTIPDDNPTSFPNIGGSPTGVNRAIWNVGLRNPFTFAFQPGTGRMYINDVGQNTWEEIDDGLAGVNYGWPTCEGGFLTGTTTPCTNPSFTNPVYTYSSSAGSECTVIGGDFYNPTNATFPASYVGKFFFADYCAGWIKYIDPASPPATGAAPTFATGLGFGTVDIHVSNDGSLHYLNRSGGTIFRVVFSGNPTPTITPTLTPTFTPTFTPTATNTPTPTATMPTPFPELDLRITQADSPDPVVMGQQLTYTLTVINDPTPIGNPACPHVRFTYPTGVPFIFNSTTGTNGYIAVPDVNGITFTNGCLSSIGGTATATITVVITPTNTGVLTSLGSGVIVDPQNGVGETNENNNSAETIQTTVGGVTPTSTPTLTPTNSATATNTPTNTPTAINTPTATTSATNTPNNTPTATSTSTNTPTNTATPTPTMTAIETQTSSPTPTATATGTPARATAFDYDGDHKSDISVFRPSEGAWYLNQSQAGLYGTFFGFGSDKIAPADYDGDGKTDIAVYRPSTGIWYVLRSSDGNVSYYVFGLAEDLPTPADYDGDGKADVSVFRPSTGTWYRQNSSDGSFFGIQFGTSEDKPTIGDFDGDGKSDIAVFRPSTGAWYRINSQDGSPYGEFFGLGSDILAPADYDGDGKTDLGVFRPSTGIWYKKHSSNSLYTYFIFGLAGDIPAPADYDGDGHADICVFRPSDGTWYRHNSSNTQFVAVQFGTNGDVPTQTAFRH